MSQRYACIADGQANNTLIWSVSLECQICGMMHMCCKLHAVHTNEAREAWVHVTPTLNQPLGAAAAAQALICGYDGLA